MTINEYKKIRNVGIDLAYKILNYDKDGRNEIIYAGKILDFWNGQAMQFESDDESDVLMDFLIYERNKKGTKLIDKFCDSDFELNGIEEEILKGMVNYHSSIFEIRDIDQDNCILIIIDLLDNNHREFKLIDIGFSQSARIGLVFFTRLIPIGDINMTSGVSFGFDFSIKDKILNEISFSKLKLKRKLNSTELFIIVHKKSKQYGMNINKHEMD